MDRRALSLIFLILTLLMIIPLLLAIVNQPVLNSPDNSTFTNNNTPDFNFNVTGNETTYTCELFLNNTGYGINTSVLNDTATIITANSSVLDGFYNWYINCTNSTTNQSEIRDITIDIVNPLFSISTSNNTLSSTLLTIEGNASDTNEDSIYCNDTKWTWNSTYSNWNFTNSSAILDGNYHILITANDSAGNTNSSLFNFTYDSTPPVIFLNASPDIIEADTGLSFINATVSDVNGIDNWNFTLLYPNGSIEMQGIGVVGNNWTFWFSDSVIGIYNITVDVIDNAGNFATSSINLTVEDTTNPLISFDSGTPANDTTSTFTYIYINWTLTEIRLENITAYLYNSTFDLINSTTFLTSTYEIKWVGLSPGTYYFNITIYDTSDNYNETETRMRTLVAAPPPATGGLGPEGTSDVTVQETVEEGREEIVEGNWIMEIGKKFSPQNPVMGFIVFCALIILIFLSFNTAPEFWKIALWTRKRNNENKGRFR